MLKGQRIIVVGGSSGIGFELAKKLVKERAEVIIASRSQGKLDESLVKLKGKCVIQQLDASNEDDVINFFTQIGEFDHLISTIKPEHLVSSFEDAEISSVKKAFDTKFWGQYTLARHCINTISKEGSVILTSGIAAHRSYTGFSGTAAINGATEALVKSLSIEFIPVRVNAVCPGFIERYKNDTVRFNSILDIGGRLPLKRLGSQSEAADAYLFLIKSKYSTGVILTIDGGELCA